MNPSFSPEGGQIAFYSARDGGGIYLVPTFGGEERLLVRGASQPCFSPDGKWIAYSVGVYWGADSRVFVIPVGEGTPKRVAADIWWTRSPVWSPDGQHLLVLGTADTYDPASLDFWLVSLEGGTSLKTGLLPLLRERQQQEFSLSRVDWVLFRVEWIGDACFLALAVGLLGQH
jgi:Tol biopolymer transport system component